MEAQAFREQLDGLAGVIAAQDPDLARNDWAGHARTLDAVEGACTWLLAHHEHLESISETQTAARRVRIHIADRCATAAALLHAAWRSKQAKAILERCAAVCPDVGDQRLYTAGVQNPEAFTQAIRASWLFQHDRHDEARKLAASLRGAPTAIAEFARHIERAPTPINDAPNLFSLNGFGLRFFGGYDEEPDGSKNRVRFVTALFVPVIPVDAYRLRENGDGSYQLYGKVKLGPLMRAWQLVALGLTALAIVWALVGAFLDSPERKLRGELDDVATLETSDPAAALERYEQLAGEYVPQFEGRDGEAELQRLVAGWVRVATAEIPEPITPAAVDPIAGIVARYSALPQRMQSGELTDPFVDRLLGWSDELGSDSTANADASLDLLIAAERLASPSRKPRVEAGTRSARIALAQMLADDWPLEAVRQYSHLLADSEARAALERVLRKLPRSATLLGEIGHELRIWAGSNPDDTELAQQLIALVQQAEQLANDPARTELLQSGDETKLRAALEQDPQDQVVVVALAVILRGRGLLDDAIGLLDGLGPVGLMTHDAQYLYASLAFEQGKLDQAAALLEPMLGNRLPAFEDARRAYDAELVKLQDRLIAKAERGEIPKQHEAALTGQDEAAARQAFQSWMDEEIQRSTMLPGLQEEYMRQADIVPVAVLLGTVQLQRARAAADDERQRLLDSAEATFLAIRGEAGGMPDYHMSLAQVYHRLGKSAEGDAEFQILIDDPDANVRLLAAAGYRELGHQQRAREVAEAIYVSASSPAKERAAMFLSLLAPDIDDRETWLRRADQTDEFVTTSLLEVEADRLVRDGEFAAADVKFERAFELYHARAERERSSFNNAALALLGRYKCTGDVRHVAEAVELMKTSVAMTPDDAIVLGNYADLLFFRVTLELLDRFVATKGLRIDGGEAATLLRDIGGSSLHERFVAAVRESPSRARALEVYAQLEVLAPQSPTSYMGQAAWYSFADNEEALAKLVERLRTVAGLDTSSAAQAHLEDLSGEDDEQSIAELTIALEARAAVRASSKRASAESRALLLQLDGHDLRARARLHGLSEQGLADARAAVGAFEEAQTLWPEGLSTDALADALLLIAIHELAAAGDQDLRDYWTEHVRAQGMSMTLVGLIERGSECIDALAKHEAFERSLELRATVADVNLDVLDLVVAKIAKDEALRARTAAELSRALVRLELEFGALLTPYDPSVTRVAEWLASELG
jgi:hypothetical protein